MLSMSMSIRELTDRLTFFFIARFDQKWKKRYHIRLNTQHFSCFRFSSLISFSFTAIAWNSIERPLGKKKKKFHSLSKQWEFRRNTCHQWERIPSSVRREIPSRRARKKRHALMRIYMHFQEKCNSTIDCMNQKWCIDFKFISYSYSVWITM